MNISMIAFESWLESAANYEKQKKIGEFSLKTISLLANELDNPQLAYKTIHVAGSKGKGSVSTMCASILNAHGFSDGLYTSPHIINFLERVKSVKDFFDNQIYEESAGELVQFIEDISERLEIAGYPQASWFELITLFAFIVFKKAGVNFGVFETGLGGRLDATNILRPEVCVITPIELEHTEYLGDTISKIAFEKAGIIKENTPVCIAVQTKEAEKVFRKIARQKHAPLYFVNEAVKKIEYSFENQKTNVFIDFGDFKTSKKSEKLFARPLKANLQIAGKVQAYNAALAALSVKIACPEISEETIEQGLSDVKMSGRFEIIDYCYNNSDNITIIFDGAHTPNSVNLSIDTYNNYFNASPCILFACAYDKHVEDIAPLFFENMKAKPEAFICTKPGDNKTSDLVRLANAFEPLCKSRGVPYELNDNYIEAIDMAVKKAASTTGILFVCGSFYLVAECKKHLKLA
ncbi:MAG: bifunctional folylpolyglutamate synthase/dihydrofolate synthase [Spirochaetaceae bacterium]|nr:bifunctional folylpolyglutamate synthase/dihydrofolate synthase [Spirochaetaceae bacterium]